jgi:hypothetical protein
VYNSLLNMCSSCSSNVVCLSYFDYSKYDLVRKAFDKMRERCCCLEYYDFLVSVDRKICSRS